MRNQLLLVSAFTLAATFGAQDAEAKKTFTKRISPEAAYAINTKGCQFPKPNPDKRWGWPNARLTVQYIQQDDGTYTIAELSGAKNPDEKLPIASITKMMTALVIFDLIDKNKFSLDRKIAVTKESLCLMQKDNVFAVKGLPAGITEIDAHHAMGQMIKKSSNTMAVNLAIALAGSVPEFVKLMNAKAKEFGMFNTHFINPHGLPEGERKLEYTTVRDMAIMGLHILPYMERLEKYETAPLETWTLPEEKKWGKIALAKLGAIFKTATIKECSSLFTLAKIGPYIMGNFQLCGTSDTRFQIALDAVKTFKSVSEIMIAPPPLSVPAANNPKFETLSLRQVQP